MSCVRFWSGGSRWWVDLDRWIYVIGSTFFSFGSLQILGQVLYVCSRMHVKIGYKRYSTTSMPHLRHSEGGIYSEMHSIVKPCSTQYCSLVAKILL
jgi:hypothetical protein